MAVVQTLHSMTLGNQTTKMYSMIQQHSPGQNNQNCVIVTIPNASVASPHSTIQQTHAAKSVIQTSKRPLVSSTPERTTVVVNNSINIANNNSAAGAADSLVRCKRKINFSHHMPYAPGHQPASVARRNARERNRVKQVNNGFATLRQHIPASVAAALSSSNSNSNRATSKKLSKVETLRMAVEYIRSLQQMIQDHENEMKNASNLPNPPTESSLLENQYYTSSPESASNLNQLGHILQPTPPCSESSASPTPSYSSEGSISTPSTYTPLTVYQPDSYENYEPMSPEDEELLDVISWWQQQ